MKAITCTALVEFTRFVEGFGQVVGAPESSLKEARRPEVPANAVAQFVKDGLVRPPKSWVDPDAEEEAVAPAPTGGSQTGDNNGSNQPPPA